MPGLTASEAAEQLAKFECESTLAVPEEDRERVIAEQLTELDRQARTQNAAAAYALNVLLTLAQKIKEESK